MQRAEPADEIAHRAKQEAQSPRDGSAGPRGAAVPAWRPPAPALGRAPAETPGPAGIGRLARASASPAAGAAVECGHDLPFGRRPDDRRRDASAGLTETTSSSSTARCRRARIARGDAGGPAAPSQNSMRLGHEPEARPERRPRHGSPANRASTSATAPIERLRATASVCALPRRPGADLAVARARREVRVGLVVGHGASCRRRCAPGDRASARTRTGCAPGRADRSRALGLPRFVKNANPRSSQYWIEDHPRRRTAVARRRWPDTRPWDPCRLWRRPRRTRLDTARADPAHYSYERGRREPRA